MTDRRNNHIEAGFSDPWEEDLWYVLKDSFNDDDTVTTTVEGTFDNETAARDFLRDCQDQSWRPGESSCAYYVRAACNGEMNGA